MVRYVFILAGLQAGSVGACNQQAGSIIGKLGALVRTQTLAYCSLNPVYFAMGMVV